MNMHRVAASHVGEQHYERARYLRNVKNRKIEKISLQNRDCTNNPNTID